MPYFWLCEGLQSAIGIVMRLVHPTGALDIGLIRDEANVATPHERASRLRYLFWVPTLRNKWGGIGDDLSPVLLQNSQGSSSQASMGPALQSHHGWYLLFLGWELKLEARMATLHFPSGHWISAGDQERLEWRWAEWRI
ncbi:hypothetical protein H5410_021627 [Solanum commersonii]|uniref:Uncharacterized protein n=1 Tax=Solanum commersonii TaxID=4109 RepID=A0A9J5ZCG8_SOLCO|nr:hypothetical protein H5410_021627 [Solanum commersonii]